MTMYDLIIKKKRGGALTDDELAFWIQGVTNDTIPNYQTSALLMAICFQGLSPHETAVLTDCMMHSGDIADISSVEGFTVDKHSTGGVGDKTTLVVAPLAAACGLKVAKMSGRGLGHTGGTVDKLEAIPGFLTTLSPAEFTNIVNQHGLCVIAQSGTIAPADKKLYALRDVTGTVDNLSLIASSIMSKKLAGGAKALCLDVKYGSGAFMKTAKDAIELAKAMVDIAVKHGRKCEALITDMDRPLGLTIGNAIEVREAVAALQGHGPDDLTTLSKQIVTTLLTMYGYEAVIAQSLVEDALQSGHALRCFENMIEAQGGNITALYDANQLKNAPHEISVTAAHSGYIAHMDTEAIGLTAAMLGAGRHTTDDIIDMGAGILMHKKSGDAVSKGEPIATLYTSRSDIDTAAVERFQSAVTYSATAVPCSPLIVANVSPNGVIYY